MSASPYVRFMRAVLGAIVALSIVVSAAPAAAQSPDEAKKVLALISDATKAFEAKDYATAEEKFSDAYEIYPDPVLLYRVGLAAEKQKKYRTALESFEKFVAAMPDDETAVKLRGRLDKVRAKVPPVVTINSRPEGAEVRLGSADGEILGNTPLEAELAAGQTTIYLSADGYETTERTFELEPAANETVDVRLVEQTRETGEGASNLAIWGWTSIGVGAALVATGATFTFLTQSKVDEVNSYNKRAPNASPGELDDLKSQADSNYQTSIFAYAAGGAIVATGIVLLIIDSNDDEGGEGSVQLDAGMLPDRAWVGLRGNF